MLMNVLISFVFRVFALLPNFLAVALGKFLGFILRIVGFRKKLIKENLKIARESFPDGYPKGFSKKIYRHFGLLFVEVLRQGFMNEKKFNKLFEVHGLENLDEALAAGKGVMSVSGHLGNWEFSVAHLAQLGYDIRLVVKDMKGVDNDFVYGLMRGRKGVGWIYKRKSVGEIFKAFKQNASVGFVVDQKCGEKEGVLVNFFGKPAYAYAGLYVLAKKKDAKVLPVYSWRDENDLKHHVKILPAIDFIETGDTQEDIRVNTQNYVTIIENAIKEHPEQWIWMHNRWKNTKQLFSVNSEQ